MSFFLRIKIGSIENRRVCARWVFGILCTLILLMRNYIMINFCRRACWGVRAANQTTHNCFICENTPIYGSAEHDIFAYMYSNSNSKCKWISQSIKILELGFSTFKFELEIQPVYPNLVMLCVHVRWEVHKSKDIENHFSMEFSIIFSLFPLQWLAFNRNSINHLLPAV